MSGVDDVSPAIDYPRRKRPPHAKTNDDVPSHGSLIGLYFRNHDKANNQFRELVREGKILLPLLKLQML